MEEELRPAFREVVIAHTLAASLIGASAIVLILALPLPALITTAAEVVPALVALFFAFKIADALVLHEQERYSVGDGAVSIRKSLVLKTATTIPLHNVTAVCVEATPIMRLFSIGSVWIYTSDGRTHPLRNLKDPWSVAEVMRPKYHFEGVFRPTVG